MSRKPERFLLVEAVRQVALVTLTDGTGLRGILFAADADGYLIRPSAVDPILYYGERSTEPEEIDRGEVFVPKARVQFIQLLGEG